VTSETAAFDQSILDLGVRSFGSARGGRRPAKDAGLVRLRSLTENDAALLDEAAPVGSKPPPIKSANAKHHSLARLLAQGVEQVEASAITGYCISRISILKQDPTFQELLAFYREQKAEVFIDTQRKLADLGNVCVDEIAERLEASADEFSTGQLLEIAELCLDRSVAPKKGLGQGGAGSNDGRPSTPTVRIEFVAPAATAALPSRPQVTIEGEILDLDEAA
jgi:hypothetical protein